MKNLNRDKFVSIDVDLSAQDPSDGGIIRLCIIPLNERGEMTDERIFQCDVKNPLHDPKYCTTKLYDQTQMNGVSADTLLDSLYKYIDSFQLHFNKRFTPVCHNWGLKQSHLRVLLMGHFDYFFTWKARDIMVCANHIDDVLHYNGYEYAYQKYDVQYIARYFRKKTAGGVVWRTKIIADTYREMLRVPKLIGE